MLDSMRQAASGMLAKILLGLLVLSFALWGVAGDFMGYGSGTVAQVGEAEVTAVDFQRALSQRLNQLSQRLGRGLTLDQAREMGIPSQLLSELVSEAALTDQALDYNLGVSDDRLATAIADDPTFQDTAGRFDRLRFQNLLRSVGMSEDDYIEEIRKQVVRQQLANAVAGSVAAPAPMVEAFYRYVNEQRTVSFVVIEESAIDPVRDPDPATLQAFFEQNKARFRAPEDREVGYLVVDTKSIAEPEAVPEDEVRAAYDQRIAEFTVPERRRIDQIRFPTEEEAHTAMAGVSGSADFDALASARGLTQSDIDLGIKTKSEIIDTVVAEAAFEAVEGAIVPVFNGTIGPAIIRVRAIEPGSVKPYEEVAPRLRAEIAERAATDQINALYDRIEDARAAGATLPEIAEELQLDYVRIDGVARDGTLTGGGRATDLPAGSELLSEVFESDVGLENNPVRAGRTGWVFYEVLNIIPDRDRTLEEVRDDVVAAWRREETSARLGELGDDLLDRLKAGADLATIATEHGLEVQTAEQITRNATPAGLSRNAVAQAFAGPSGHVANAEADVAPNRILLNVDTVITPAFFAEAEDAKRIAAELGQALQTDILHTYNAHLLQTRDPFINSAIFAQLSGEPGAQAGSGPR